MSQVEINKAIIQRYFEAYNNKNEAIFDEIILPDFSTMVNLLIWAPLEWELLEQKNDLKNSLNKLDDMNYVVEAMISSPGYPDLVGAYWKGSLASKASTSDTHQTNKIINYRGVDVPNSEWKNG